MGRLCGADWHSLLIAGPAHLLPPLLTLTQSAALDGPLLEETEAYHLGVAIERTKHIVTLPCALSVRAAAALTGVIGCPGLILPHLARRLVGPDRGAVTLAGTRACPAERGNGHNSLA